MACESSGMAMIFTTICMFHLYGDITVLHEVASYFLVPLIMAQGGQWPMATSNSQGLVTEMTTGPPGHQRIYQFSNFKLNSTFLL